MGWPSSIGVGVWQFLLEVGGLALSFSGLGLACHSSGVNWSCLFGVGFGLSFELALPSRDGELALLSRGWFFSSVVVGPSCPSFLLSVVLIPSWNGGWPDESWPCCLGEREKLIGFLLNLSFPWWEVLLGVGRSPEKLLKGPQKKTMNSLEKSLKMVSREVSIWALFFSFLLSSFFLFLLIFSFSLLN